MLSRHPVVAPKGILRLAAAQPPVRTAVAKADGALALESVKSACEAGLIEPLLFGDREEIGRLAKALDFDLRGIEIFDVADERRAAGEAAMAAGRGEADLLFKGQVHSDVYVGAILEAKSRLRAGRRLSHVFHMTVPESERALMITDGAVNIQPSLETKKQILANALDLTAALGYARPRVAVLSASEEVMPAMPSSVEARELAEWGMDAFGDRADIHGPLAFDNAVSPEAARVKGIDHPVAGQADVLLVPSIETGNGLFKMLVYFRSACAAGVVLGAKVPAVLTSRADPPAARLTAVAIATLLARQGAEGTR